MPIDGPTSVGGQQYRLTSVTWCLYSMTAGSKVDYVEVWLDPARQHLPVQARFTTLPGGEPLELLLAAVDSGP